MTTTKRCARCTGKFSTPVPAAPPLLSVGINDDGAHECVCPEDFPLDDLGDCACSRLPEAMPWPSTRAAMRAGLRVWRLTDRWIRDGRDLGDLFALMHHPRRRAALSAVYVEQGRKLVRVLQFLAYAGSLGEVAPPPRWRRLGCGCIPDTGAVCDDHADIGATLSHPDTR